MTKANFKSKSFSAGKMSGSLREHNERDFDALYPDMDLAQSVKKAKAELKSGRIEKLPHFRPAYILPDEYHLGNESGTYLTMDEIKQDYITNNPYGQKHKKFHHRTEPWREAIIHFERHHTLEDLELLKTELERELDIRCMYIQMHKDEGHISKHSGEVKYNFHAHFGFTNISKAGESIHFDATKCKRAQGICASVLGMERGIPGGKEESLEHRAHRAREQAREEGYERGFNTGIKKSDKLVAIKNQEISFYNDQLKNAKKRHELLDEKYTAAKKQNHEQYDHLVELHEEIKQAAGVADFQQARARMKESGLAKKEDYQELSKWRKLGKTPEEVAEFVRQIEQRNQQLQRQTAQAQYAQRSAEKNAEVERRLAEKARQNAERQEKENTVHSETQFEPINEIPIDQKQNYAQAIANESNHDDCDYGLIPNPLGAGELIVTKSNYKAVAKFTNNGETIEAAKNPAGERFKHWALSLRDKVQELVRTLSQGRSR